MYSSSWTFAFQDPESRKHESSLSIDLGWILNHYRDTDVLIVICDPITTINRSSHPFRAFSHLFRHLFRSTLQNIRSLCLLPEGSS